MCESDGNTCTVYGTASCIVYSTDSTQQYIQGTHRTQTQGTSMVMVECYNNAPKQVGIGYKIDGVRQHPNT
jgi:uncharacterized membrane protein YjjP (DUF1212 family)